MADEEDVAAIVFRNLWQGAEAGHFPELLNRENLWPLLVVLTSRRVHDLLRYQNRRGKNEAPEELDHVIAEDPTPQFAAMMSENVSRLFAVLDPTQRQVAQGKLEGLENAEIARQLGCTSGRSNASCRSSAGYGMRIPDFRHPRCRKLSFTHESGYNALDW